MEILKRDQPPKICKSLLSSKKLLGSIIIIVVILLIIVICLISEIANLGWKFATLQRSADVLHSRLRVKIHQKATLTERKSRYYGWLPT